MKKIIIITGGSGFIGSNLIKKLLKKTKYNIISIDNYYSGFKKNNIQNHRIKYIKSHTREIKRKLSKYKKKIKALFHFGEFSRIHQSFEHRDICFDFNIAGTYEVIKFCSENKIKLIYSASSSKFGNKGKDENLSPYAWTKSKNIELIKNFSTWYGLRYEILYFYNVYGPNHIKNHFMSAVIGIFESQYVKNIPLTVVRPGTQKRDFTHVDDIVDGCLLALNKGKQSEYLLGTGKLFSILQVAKLFSKKIKFINERQGERLTSILKPNNSYAQLGYKPKKDLKKYILNFKKNYHFLKK